MSPRATEALLAWFSKNARDLPWRHSRDAYAIWISEVMLQQTRVETVIPYYLHWRERFPDVQTLACAPLEDVLRIWEGLGYYRRAHNLHRAARQIVDEYGGELPREPALLKRLPGIGDYTAAAIAAIAFDDDVVALDGNLRRVLARLFGLQVDPRSPEGERILIERSALLLPAGRASDFNQALMDLGASICLPRNPACERCPVAAFCEALEQGIQGELPVRTPKPPIPHHAVAAGVLRRAGKIMVGRRPEGVLLGGLWEFPGGKVRPGESPEGCLRRELAEELGVAIDVGKRLGVYKHAYTHFRITVYAFECGLVEGEPRALEHAELRWVGVHEMDALPMGKVDRLIVRTLQGVG